MSVTPTPEGAARPGGGTGRRIIYVDELNAFSAAWLARHRGTVSGIYYIDVSGWMKRVLPVFRRVFLRGTPILPLDFYMGDIRTERGENLFIKISFGDIGKFHGRMVRDHLDHDPLCRMFARRFGAAEISLYVKIKTMRALRRYNSYLYAAAWHARSLPANPPADPGFLLSHFYSDLLAGHAMSLGLRVTAYTNFSRLFSRWIRILKRLLWPVLSLRGLTQKNAGPRPAAPILAAGFNGKYITFDPSVRSDFFWLIPSSLPRSRVMICFHRHDYPVTAEMVDTLRSAGMNFVAFSESARVDPRVPLFSPGPRAAWDLAVWNARLAVRVLTAMFSGAVSSFYLDLFADFVRHYAWWGDFFRRYGVSVYININDASDDSVPFHLALKAAGGVSVSYQFSAHSLNHSPETLILPICRDVFFSFGPYYRPLLDSVHTAIGHGVYTGYITDQAFELVKERSRGYRERLQRAGANFIVAFFDENSSDDRMRMVSNRRMTGVYRRFLDAVLSDPTLGLILKPGYPGTLFKRLPDIRPLVDRARSTGRCLLLDEGVVVTRVLPTEAAQAADLAVGFLYSGTAAMESVLSGTPTVYFDFENLFDQPEYQWPARISLSEAPSAGVSDAGRIVFNTWEELWTAIQSFRREARSRPDLRRTIPFLSQKDPFQDGRAAERMGEYLSSLLMCLEREEPAAGAVAWANRKFSEKWGADKIVSRAVR